LITAAATIWVVLRVSKWAARLAVISACALVIGGFTPVGYWLALPLENRFPQWEADDHEIRSRMPATPSN
jgi:hypothetical protein